MFFDNWFDLWRIIVVGILAYGGLIVLLRLTGKRTLSKMNAFDLVVTVALGSTLASTLMSSDVALLEGLLAFTVLCLLQYLITWTSLRWAWVQGLVKAEPSMLFFRGAFLGEMLRRERVTEEEILAAIRAQGHSELSGIEAVVLETDGSFSVLSKPEAGHPADTLQGVKRGPGRPVL
ncbi:uncharacterized membrane protein YcaP (DUF421 family) [Rhodoligotrophos appendicifer]|uniref:DUF421 domain-containing protein n=1 Tax=Rhodoligotrophos appendicifer TaxID=987056 RepID=UPI0011848E0B|nr:YetF domain-containing protein [Rhodoligotrophos appendicifer]